MNEKFNSKNIEKEDNSFNPENTLFVIPQNDAEAIATREFLDRHKADYVITKQPWGANWYEMEEDILDIVNSTDKNVIGVEILGDKVSALDDYSNDEENEDKKTSLEILSELYNEELSVRDKFISANTKGYIPEMKTLGEQLGLSEEEVSSYIKIVNELEMKAQGISEVDIEQAKEAIGNAYIYDKRLVWLDVPSMQCMRPLTNDLYEIGEYDNMFYETISLGIGTRAISTVDIDDDKSQRIVVFSNTDTLDIISNFFENDERTWRGGTKDAGFWGIQFNIKEKEEMCSKIQDLLEDNILGYRRLIDNKDIISSEKYSDTVIAHQINNPEAFSNCLKCAYDNNPHGAFINMDYSTEDYNEMKKIIINAGAAGIAVKNDGDIVSVFKNPDMSAKDDIGKINQALLLESIRIGGNHLDCFDGFLPKLYGNMGFKPICKLKFNDEFAPKDWNFERDGRPDIIFMAHNGDSVEEIMRKNMVNGYKPINEELKKAPYVQDYDEADILVKKYIEEIDKQWKE